jgi:hypothetical protein
MKIDCGAAPLDVDRDLVGGTRHTTALRGSGSSGVASLLFHHDMPATTGVAGAAS